MSSQAPPGLRGKCSSILSLGVAERPNLIDLDALRRNIADRAVLILSTSRTDLAEQLQDRLLAHASHAACGANRAPFDQGRDDRRFLVDAEYVCHTLSIRQRFRIRKTKVMESAFLLCLFGFGPSRLGGFSGASSALFVCHGFEPTLAADASALGSHLAHYLLNKCRFNRFSGCDGLQNYAAGILDRIKRCSSAFPLWHNLSVAQMAGGVKL